MEVFSGLMGMMATKQDFKYHWRFEKEKITHLCFVADLVVFCRAEIGSISLIGDCLNQFKALFGLTPNPDKSNLFASGVSSYLKDQLLDVLGYKEGVLPVCYLGVPLFSTKLRASDFKVLVDHIVAKAKSWTCYTLSYAGRLQLIKSGCDLGTSGIKVAWAKICMPKEEGVLGLCNMEIWNKAAMLKHLCYLLKGRTIWELKCPGDCSWNWRKILGPRDIARDKMKFKIGNGRRASLWFDNWHPLAPLERIICERIVHESRLSILAKVADIVDSDTWRWPSGGSCAWSLLCSDPLGVSLTSLPLGDLVHTDKGSSLWLETVYAMVKCFSWMEQFHGRSFRFTVIRLMFAASIYAIWCERSARTHGEAPKHESAIIQDVVFTICTRVDLCKGLAPSNENRWFQRSWDFSMDIFSCHG
ncbi:uncharacterized protein LOC111365693 [Olea europaea var. sylvestris]|uniref:uncharacterized protein LOC111365693 n=1 Tax=Olea europaea var. sylvestris TaxID=158386 RepID=UPI000C1D097A|nr:uncharacterized protein LOC111365693 [Olea europaea var. sylvestris]